MLIVFDGISQEELDEIIDRVNERNCPWLKEAREREEAERKHRLENQVLRELAEWEVKKSHFRDAIKELKRIRQDVIDHKTDLRFGDVIALGPEGFVLTV